MIDQSLMKEIQIQGNQIKVLKELLNGNNIIIYQDPMWCNDVRN